MCIILVVPLELYAIIFACINILIVHDETRDNLFRLTQVFWHLMVQREEIKNQLHDIVVAVI
jgi:hypothetical protein